VCLISTTFRSHSCLYCYTMDPPSGTINPAALNALNAGTTHELFDSLLLSHLPRDDFGRLAPASKVNADTPNTAAPPNLSSSTKQGPTRGVKRSRSPETRISALLAAPEADAGTLSLFASPSSQLLLTSTSTFVSVLDHRRCNCRVATPVFLLFSLLARLLLRFYASV